MDDGSAHLAHSPAGRGKRWQPTEEMRLTVKVMAACGRTQEDIAAKVSALRAERQGLAPITRRTLSRVFAFELANGRSEVIAQLEQSLYQTALAPVSEKNPPEVKLRACIFALKTRGGFFEARPPAPQDRDIDEATDVVPRPAGAPGQALTVLPRTLEEFYGGLKAADAIAAARRDVDSDSDA
jgi:hypothetical protein